MRAKGIAYDTGLLPGDGAPGSRPDFDPALVGEELRIIRDDLHCTAVHIVGTDPGRLETAARLAAGLGLEVWFSPYPVELEPGEILALFSDCAERAERIRAEGAGVVFVAGVELSIMNPGFFEGAGLQDRLHRLLAAPGDRGERIAAGNARLAPFLREAAALVRARFRGPVTYAAVPFERVDWDLFDFVTVELIRSAEVADRFREGVRALVAQPRPVAVTGFACATWRGAGEVAPRSMEIVRHDPDTGTARVDGGYRRDEAGQAAYLAELLEIFESEGVDGAFVYLFALYSHPHRPGGDPRDDLDLASPGIVKVLEDRTGTAYPGMPWEPKEAFAAVAAHYAR